MNSPFFSIIIPVYNVEPYIARCLDSVINQTFEDIEIIIVDDCGSDRSIEIAKGYADRDKRIKIIHNPCNLGLFHARIEGEKQACGEYILHVDSDDFIKLETCEILYKKIQDDYQESEQWCDICCFGMEFYPKTSKRVKPLSPTQILHNQEIMDAFLYKPSTPSWTIWNKTYKTTLVQQVHNFISTHLPNLPHLTMAEDALKFFIITLFAKKSIGVEEELYYYYASDSSITRKTDTKTRDKKTGDLQAIIDALDLIPLSDFPHLPSLNHSKLKTQNILKSVIELESRYDDVPFAYPKACLKSLRHYKKWQTYIRLLAYFLSFGKIKL